MENNYGNQSLFLEWRSNLLPVVIDKIKKGCPLKEVMPFIALERNRIAQVQICEKKIMYSIEDTDITNFNKNKLILFSLKKNALTAEEQQEFDKLCFIKQQESSNFALNFGQVRSAEFNAFGVPINSDSETISGTPNCSLVYHKKISENKADYTGKIKIEIDVLSARPRRVGNRLVKRNSTQTQKTVEHYTVLWNDCELTKISANQFVHTDKKYFAPVIEHVALLYEALPTLADKTLIKRNINQMYWLLIHAMIYFRGNASITEIFIECLYKIYDIEAQCVDSVVLLGNPDIDCLTNYPDIQRSPSLPASKENIVIAIVTLELINSGGVKALHHLAQKINNLKYENISAKLICINNGYKKYNNSYCNDFISPSEINEYTVVVYPEIIRGNPLNAKHVVRWILMELNININPVIELSWKKQDIVYHWEQSICQNDVNDMKRNIKVNQLTTFFVDKEFVKYNNEARTKTCYLIKKGLWLHNVTEFNNIHPTDSINIDNMSLDNIIQTFNECHTFYCYDPNTFYIIGAPLCGCITIIYPFAHINEEDYFKNRNFYKSGISYGILPENINQAKETLTDAQTQLNILMAKYENTVDLFLNDMHHYMRYTKKLLTIENVYNHTFNFNTETKPSLQNLLQNMKLR